MNKDSIKLGVIADTHLRGPTPGLRGAVERYFRDVDMILHAGDLITMEVLEAFGDKEVIAVAGNNDSREVKERLHQEEIIEIKGLKIGLVHGWGFPFGLQRRLEKIIEGADCIIFGHSHWPVNRRRDGILYFNPGAFNGGIFSLWRRSLGLLTIDSGIRGDIIRVPNRFMFKDRV